MAIEAGNVVWNITADLKPLNDALGDSEKMVNQSMGNILKTGQQVGMAFTAIGAGIVAGLGVGVKAASDFGSAMAEVNTLGVQDLGKLEDAVKSVSQEYGLELTGAAKAAYQAISAGASEAQTPKLLAEAAKAATAGVSDLTTAIELGTSVSNAYGKNLDDVNKIYDQAFIAVKNGVTTFNELASSVGKVSPTMAALNLDSREMFASVAALTKAGISTSESVTGLKAALTSVIKPQGAAAETAKALGIEFNAQALTTKGLSGFLAELKEKTGGNVETLSKLFGSVEALNAILALTGTQSGSFNATLAEMGSGVAATDEAFKKLVETDPSFAFKQLKSEMSVLAVEIGQALLPTLKKILDAITPIIHSIVAWIQNNPQLTATITLVVAAFGAVMTVLGPLLIMLPGIVIAFAAIGPVVAAAGGILAALAAGPVLIVIAALGALVAAGVYVYKHWEEFVEGAKILWEAFSTAMSAVWDGIKDAFEVGVYVVTTPLRQFVDGVQAGWEILQIAAGYLVDTFNAAWDAIVGGFEWVGDQLEGLWNWITGLMKSGVDGIIAAINYLSNLFGLGNVFSAPDTAGDIPGRAKGGPVEGGMPYIVGEQGQELFVPQQDGRIVPAGQTAQMMRGGGPVTININGYNRDPRGLAQEISRIMRDDQVLFGMA